MLQRKAAKVAARVEDDLGLPDMEWGLYDAVAAHDPMRGPTFYGLGWDIDYGGPARQRWSHSGGFALGADGVAEDLVLPSDILRRQQIGGVEHDADRLAVVAVNLDFDVVDEQSAIFTEDVGATNPFDGIDVVLVEIENGPDGSPARPKFIMGKSYDWPRPVAEIVLKLAAADPGGVDLSVFHSVEVPKATPTI